MEQSEQVTKYYSWRKNELWLNVYVQPNAKENAVSGLHGDRLKIKIASPPCDDLANTELTAFLAAYFGVMRSSVEIIKGLKSRNKLVSISSPKKNLPPRIVDA